MTQIDGRPIGDAEHMPARWYSVQWLSIRILWALLAAGVLTRKMEPGSEMLVGGLVVGVLVFAGLTAVAYYERRRWARDHS